MTIKDGNEAAVSAAYRASEVIAIYPITPASPMGEASDEWAARQHKNLWGEVPRVIEMQSEAGAAGAVHGALLGGALATTFTASQGLMLMLPNLYKIAGELQPFCLHVAARTLATHALSIFGDHSDVMAARGTGCALLCSSSVQEAHDFACIAHATTLDSRIPFLHFFDGFRTSHELTRMAEVSDEVLRGLLSETAISAHRARALSPDHPQIRGTAQNPDTFFQAREAANPYYRALPGLLEANMERFFAATGRRHRLYEYRGHPEAEHVVVVMGSAAHTLFAVAEAAMARGERIGVLSVHCLRPFASARFIAALPRTVKRIAVLDRVKEPGAPDDPLMLDVLSALNSDFPSEPPRVIAGRYGLSSKEFSPAMARAVFDELARPSPRRRFTIGIVDDVSQLSLDVGPALDVLPSGTFQALFYGLGADGTVGANKNTLKIVGEHTELWPQGYFVYDSRKSGSMTVSHLRFFPRRHEAPYLIEEADFVAVHQFDFFTKIDVLERLRPGGTLLVNSPYPAEETFRSLPVEVRQELLRKRVRVHAVDAYRIARDAGLSGRINTVMQACFFALTKLMPLETALAEIRDGLEHTYGKKGSEIVRRNMQALDESVHAMFELALPSEAGEGKARPPVVPGSAPDFVQRVTSVMLAGKGDLLPVSAFPADGAFATGTSRWEKRNIASEIPVWDEQLCIQCNKCVLMCPHAAIRAKVYDEGALAGAPAGFKHASFRSPDLKNKTYTLQVAAEDCTGCHLCAEVCPARDKSNPRRKALMMEPQRALREAERERYDFFLGLPEIDRRLVRDDVKHLSLLQPLFEYSGACAGCGETPYIKLLTQLFGDRAVIANATGCSSIYGGNLPTTPYTTDPNGRGPAWANSLFEDNAEFGLGLRLGIDALRAQARTLLTALAPGLPGELVNGLLECEELDEKEVSAQRERVASLMTRLAGDPRPEAARLRELADYLVRKSLWLVGGDGWAYDIGFGGLDHVLASGADVNILVLDTEVYSNTGGQQSKATPLGAAAKFAAFGKSVPKKDLGLIAMAYDHVYVAEVAMGAKDNQTVSAFVEAERHRGPSLIIAYSHCIAHGYDLRMGAEQQKLAVETGIWPLYRFDPRRAENGEPPLHLDSGAAKRPVLDYTRNEARFRMVEQLDARRFAWLAREAQLNASRRVEHYQKLSELRVSKELAKSEEE